MAQLWGEFLPVAEPNLQALAGGERLDMCGHRIDAAYTPGHASHHVCGTPFGRRGSRSWATWRAAGWGIPTSS